MIVLRDVVAAVRHLRKRIYCKYRSCFLREDDAWLLLHLYNTDPSYGDVDIQEETETEPNIIF